MKFLRKLDESFQLFKQDDLTQDGKYAKRVKNACYHIGMEEMGISEKNFQGLDRLELVMEQVMYHTIHQGRLKALSERDWMNGGFKR